MFTPPHNWPAYWLLSGVKRMGTKRTPAKPAWFSARASRMPSSHGAPISSNGVSVPRPTDKFVISNRPIPGYKTASAKLRMFGDGLTHSWPVRSK